MMIIDRIKQASEKINWPYENLDVFQVEAMHWLAKQWGDVRVEYHGSTGWEVSFCCDDGRWCDDGWLTGDGELKGTLAGALLAAVEAAVPK